MDRPWDDPTATGHGRMVDAEEYARFVRSTLDAFDRNPTSVMGAGTPHVQAIIDFARRHGMHVVRDQPQSDKEIWALTLEHERLDRDVCVVITRADWCDGWMIAVRTGANWVGGPTNTFCTLTERRWFGLTDRSPVAVLEDTLERALSDAMSYGTHELVPRADEIRLRRPW